MSPTAANLPRTAVAAAVSAAAAAAVTAAAWFGVLGPARADAAAAAEAGVQLAEATSAATDARERLGAAAEAEAALRESVLRGVQPGDPTQRNARLAALLTLAEAAGLEVLRLDPADPADRGGHAVVSIEIEARGPYAAHHGFLGRLHAGPTDLSVSALRLRGGGGAPLAGGYTLAWVVAVPDTQPTPAAGGAPR